MVLVQGGRSTKIFLPERQAAPQPSRRNCLSAIARLSAAVRRRVIAIGRLRFAWPIHWFSAWRQNAASRRHLAALNEYYLKDIGLTRHDMAPNSSPPSRLW